MFGNAVNTFTTIRQHFGLGAARFLGLCLSAILFFCATPAQAQYATGGSGLHKSRIFWVDWGNNGDNVYAGKTITRGFNVDTPASAANRLDISCTLSNAATTRGTAGLYVYSPGNWQGDGLDNLYNIGGFQNGSGANPNTLSVGLRTNAGSTVEFDFACSATFAGANFPLNGLVFADAEASGSTEYVSAKLTGGGTMRVIDSISQCGAAGSVNVVAGPPQEVQLTSASSCEGNATASLRAGPALVGFIDGATSARVVAKGGGISAVAVGAVIELEYSEAIPNSYGIATHVLDATWSGGVATNGVNYINPANLATFGYTAPILGATVVPDIDANGTIGGSDVDALAKTTGSAGAGYANVPPPNGPGTNYTINTVKCIGPGFVAGWIDFNGNGVFDTGEKSNSVACPAGANTIALTWAVPSGTGYVAQQASYLRLRTATTAAGVSLASGPILGGEAEDYYIALPIPSLGGKVWLDADGSAAGTFSNINTGGESGSNAGGLNAILVDASGNVLQSVAVAADGTYSFSNVPANTTVSIRLSTSSGTVGQPAPATNLPTGWANTSPLSTAAFSTGTASVNNKDFGLDRLPDSSNVSSPSQINPGGSTQLQAPTLAGNDPDDGAIGINKSFQITSLPSNGTLYYNGVALNTGDVIVNYDPTKLTVDPNDNATTLSFQYAAVDAAGKPDPTPATASMTLQPPAPSIGAAKSVVSGPILNANGTFTVTYSVLVKNLGNVVLNNAQISDDLLAAFPAPATFSVSGIAGSDSNTSFDGDSNKNLLVAGLTLPVGASRTVQFAVTVTPNGAFGTRSNQALASGTPPAGGSVTDLSDSGTDPDPNNNGNPSDPGENDTTPITLTAPAAPVATDDNGQTIPGQSIGIPVIANDGANGGLNLVPSSIDLDPSTPGQDSSITIAGKGTFVLQPNGTVQFTPAPGFTTGSVTIPYTIKDALGQTSNAANITVLVSVPAAQSDVANTPYQTPINFNVSGNDTTVPGRSIVAASIDLDPSSAGSQTTFSVPGQGTFTANPDGTVDFVPVNGFVGTVSIPYTIQDSAAATSAPADIIVTVTPPPAPVAANNTSSTPYQTPTTINITGNDSANGGATINAASVDLDPGTPGQQTSVVTTQGTWAVDNAGNVTFAPANGFTGVATLPYTVQDNLGQASNMANIAITVTAPAAPVATDDTSSTPYLTPTTLNIASNDSANGGATINAASVDLDPSTPAQDSSITTAQGVWTVDNTGNVTFAPANGFTGVATLPYSIKDNLGQVSNTANIAITVAAPPAPVATNDTSGASYQTPKTINITGNDNANGGATLNTTSVDLDPSTPGIDSSITTAQGVWTTDGTGKVTFTPANGFVGTATLPYTVQDNLGQTSNIANITVTVASPNAPIANDDTASTPYQTPTTLNITANDSANGGATINAASVDLDPSTPGIDSSITTTQGIWTVDNTGNITFTPANGFAGVATLPYSIKDNLDQTSNTANINITVTAPAAPIANDDNSNTPFQTPVVFPLLNNDSANGGATINNASVDLDPNTPGIDSSITVPGEGTFTYNPSNGTMMFTPAPGFAGVAHIAYTAKDSLGQTSNVANIGVVVAPPPAPTASDDTKTTTLNTPVAIDVSSNDTTSSGTNLVPSSIDLDPNTPGQQNTISVPGKGTFALQPNGTVLFTPAPGFSGTTTTQYTIQDNLGQTSTPADINVTVIAKPSANDDTADTAFNTPVTLPAPSNDTPASGASLVPASIDLDPNTPGQQSTFTVAGKGTFVLQPNGTVQFTPVAGFVGTVNAPYTIQDNFGQTSNNASLSVTVTKAPAATDDVATTTAATPVAIPFATNDQANPGGTINPNSIDLDPSTPGLDSSITLPNQGTFALQPDGTVVFTPAPGFSGLVTAPYTVQDNQGTTTAPATISVTVVAAPKTNADTSTTNFNTPTTVNVITNDQPSNPATINPNSIDLDPSTPGLDSSVTVPGKGTFTSNPDGSITFTPVPGFTGPASVPYTVKDSLGQTSNPSTLTVNVQPGAPVASNDYSTSDANSPTTLNPGSNDNGNGAALDPNSIDLDPSTPGQESSISIPGKGTFVLQPNGSVVFTPAPGFVGTVTAPYTIKDTNGKTSNSAQLVVNVNPLPSAKDDNASTAHNTPVVLPVLGNDTPNTGATMNPGSIDLDPATPGQQNTISIPGKGTFKTNPDGTVTFTPVAGFAGTISTPYTAQDSGGKTTNTAKITVTVRPPDAPVANDDSATAAYGSGVTIKPGSNDTGVGLNAGGIDLDPATPGQQTTINIPGKGTFTLNTTTGEVTFTPINGFSGEVALPYTIQDQFGQTSNTATIRITVGQPKLVLVKTASKPNATIGDELGWVLQLSNQSFVPVNTIVFSDHMPAGLLYKPGSSKLQGKPVADPSITVVDGKQVLTWTFQQTLGANASLGLVFASTVLPSATESTSLVNTASASAKAGVGGVIAVSANQASAAVKINPGIFAPTTTIVGRVYVDNNNNNSFELGTDEPVPGARVYLSDGRYAITDADGRYSITNIAPGSYAVRLDPLTTAFAPKALPDDQGQPGTRSVRTNETPGGISTEDFPLQAPSSDVDKTRRTVVEVGAVKLEKSIKTGQNGYTIELKLTLSTAATNLRITDPLPNGATRGPVYLVGAGGQVTELSVDTNGQIVLPSLDAGVYTIVYTVKSKLPSDLVFTDPSITYTP